MGEVLYNGKLIYGKNVYSVTLEDTTLAGTDGVRYQIDLLDADGDRIASEQKVVGISRTWLAMQPYLEADLIALLIQFRRRLPRVITSKEDALFKFPDWKWDVKLYKIGQLLRTYFGLDRSAHLPPECLRNSVTIEYFEILSVLGYLHDQGVIRHDRSSDEDVVVGEDWPTPLGRILDDLKPLSWEPIGGGVVVVPEPVVVKIGVSDPVVTISPTRCPVPMPNGDLCGRPAEDSGGRCICHCEEPKELGPFEIAVAEVLSDDNAVHDFTGFVFPEDFRFPDARRFAGSVVFFDCQFRCLVSLRESVFTNQLLIANSRFERGASLANSQFQGSFEIRECELSLLNLSYSVFQDGFVFMRNVIRPGLVVNAEENGNQRLVDMRGTVFENGQQVFLKDIKASEIALGGCNLATAGHLQFEGLSRNDNTTYWLADEGPVLAHEGLRERPYRQRNYALADSYQQIQRHMISIRNYTAAGGFHEREMDVRRKHLAGSVVDRLLFELYSLLSRYGESLKLPVFWLALLLASFPIATSLWMGNHNLDWIGYAEWSIGDVSICVKEWLCDVVRNVESLFFVRGEPFWPRYSTDPTEVTIVSEGWRLLIIVERVFAAILVSFIVINVRRRFRRY